MSKSLKQIIENHLFDKGYDGLFDSETHCSCTCEKLMPCKNPSENCMPGFNIDGDLKIGLCNEK